MDNHAGPPEFWIYYTYEPHVLRMTLNFFLMIADFFVLYVFVVANFLFGIPYILLAWCHISCLFEAIFSYSAILNGKKKKIYKIFFKMDN